MSFLSRILARFGRDRIESARSRDTGGVPDAAAPDQHSSTGTTPNDTFVGRASGQDAGYLETGAERRAEQPDQGGDGLPDQGGDEQPDPQQEPPRD